MSESQRCPLCGQRHEPAQFGPISILPCPKVPKGELVAVGARNIGKSYLLKLLAENEPEFEIRSGELKGDLYSFEMVMRTVSPRCFRVWRVVNPG